MSLLDAFTGAPYTQAATQQRQYLGDLTSNVNQRIGGAVGTGLGQLTSGLQGATDAINTGISTGSGAIGASVNPAIIALTGGTTQGADALSAGQTGGLADLQSGVTNAVGAYDPLAEAAGSYGERATQASNMSEDALGLNGPEGVARATAAFQAGPGYKFGLDQGLESILRNANAGGMVASGNQLRESQTFGQGLANQEFDKWKAGLMGRESLYAPLERGALGDVASGRGGAYLAGGTGAAGIRTGTAGRLSDLYSGSGKGVAGVYTGAGQSLADLAAKGGLALGDIEAATGARGADLIRQLTSTQTGFDQNIAQPYANTYQQDAAAQVGGSANLWNLVGNAAKMAAGGGWLPSGSFTPYNLGGKAA